jgi:hypothetical protein
MDNKSTSSQIFFPHTVAIILTFCSITVLLVYLVYAENFVFGSTAGKWTYPFFSRVTPISYWIPITVLILLGIFIFIGSKTIFNYEKLTLLGSFFVAIAIQLIVNSVYPIPLGVIVESDQANSFYTSATAYSTLDLLSRFQELAPSLSGHAQTNMPGKIIFFQFLGLFTSSPRITAYLIISISTLGGLLLYAISKRLFCDRLTGFYSLVLYTLIPAKLFFFPILNTVTPVFILSSLYLLLLYIDFINRWFLILLGFSLYGLILFEPSPLVTGLIFISVLLSALGLKRISTKELTYVLLIPALSFIAIYLLFLGVFSFDLGQTFQYILEDAVGFNEQIGRGYWTWIGANLKEFFYVAGSPVMMIFIYYTIVILSQLKNAEKNVLRWPIENWFVFSLLITFVIVLFLGINRGEITRLWIYLAVFFQIPASIFMAKIIKSNALFFVLAVALVSQSLIALQKVNFISP